MCQRRVRQAPTHARAYVQEFTGWHNDHHHSGLALFSPAEVFHGPVELVAAQRQCALDAAYAAHPERFPNGPPVVRRPPESVSIDPFPSQKTSSRSTPYAPHVCENQSHDPLPQSRTPHRIHDQAVSNALTRCDADGLRRLGTFFSAIGDVLNNKKRRESYAIYAMGLLGSAARKSAEPLAAAASGDPKTTLRLRLSLRAHVRTKRAPTADPIPRSRGRAINVSPREGGLSSASAV